jgi:hypothetical protein
LPWHLSCSRIRAITEASTRRGSAFRSQSLSSEFLWIHQIPFTTGVNRSNPIPKSEPLPSFLHRQPDRPIRTNINE